MVLCVCCFLWRTFDRPSTIVLASSAVKMPVFAKAFAYAWLPCGAKAQGADGLLAAVPCAWRTAAPCASRECAKRRGGQPWLAEARLSALAMSPALLAAVQTTSWLPSDTASACT